MRIRDPHGLIRDGCYRYLGDGEGRVTEIFLHLRHRPARVWALERPPGAPGEIHVSVDGLAFCILSSSGAVWTIEKEDGYLRIFLCSVFVPTGPMPDLLEIEDPAGAVAEARQREICRGVRAIHLILAPAWAAAEVRPWTAVAAAPGLLLEIEGPGDSYELTQVTFHGLGERGCSRVVGIVTWGSDIVGLVAEARPPWSGVEIK